VKAASAAALPAGPTRAKRAVILPEQRVGEQRRRDAAGRRRGVPPAAAGAIGGQQHQPGVGEPEGGARAARKRASLGQRAEQVPTAENDQRAADQREDRDGIRRGCRRQCRRASWLALRRGGRGGHWLDRGHAALEIREAL